MVTGGAGYIGSHACKTLKKLGFIPVTLDNISTGWKDAVKFGPFERVDLLKREEVSRVFEVYSPIAVMHFAAHSQVGESLEKPGLYWENNVVGSLNLVQAAVNYGCLDFIFSSTCAVYGNQNNIVLDENSLLIPNNAYAASKQAIENILLNYKQSYGLNYVIFRYFNVAGADHEAEIGEFHKPETHLIPNILDVLEGKQKSVTIFGTDYDTPDGTCIRDYIHVCDLIDAHVLGLEWLREKKGDRIFNLGTGRGFSVLEIINEIEKITKKTVPINKGSRRAGDCSRLVSSSARAKQELGWAANRSNITQIITDALRWHRTANYSE